MSCIGHFMGETGRLFLYDVLNKFSYNRFFLLYVVFPVTLFVLVCSLILVLIIEKKIVLRWKVRICKRKFVFGEFNFIRKNNGKICFIALIIALIMLFFTIGSNLVRQKNDKWSEYTTVAHAGGRIGGHDYSDCVDAILVNYESGQRTFEIDFAVTSDNKLVGKHDWDYV
jgi:hypothetical protein